MYVPVITELHVVDQKEYAQERRYQFDNTQANNGREVHTKSVVSTSDGITNLDVERIDRFSTVDQKEQAQERRFVLDNNDPPPSLPAGGDPKHRKTHVVRYCKDNDETGFVWVDSELIDEMRLIDQKDHAQESIIILDNPAGQTFNYGSDPYMPTFVEVDMTLEEIDEGDGDTVPVRLDPFQNIVNVGPSYLYFVWTGILRGDYAANNEVCSPVGISPPGQQSETNGYQADVYMTGGWNYAGPDGLFPTDPTGNWGPFDAGMGQWLMMVNEFGAAYNGGGITDYWKVGYIAVSGLVVVHESNPFLSILNEPTFDIDVSGWAADLGMYCAGPPLNPTGISYWSSSYDQFTPSGLMTSFSFDFSGVTYTLGGVDYEVMGVGDFIISKTGVQLGVVFRPTPPAP